MRFIHISEYQRSSMQLALPVYDSHRRVLLAPQATIHPKYLEKLEEIGIQYLFVEDAVSRGIGLEHVMDMPTWFDIVDVVKLCHSEAKAKKPLPLPQVQKAVAKLLAELRSRPLLVSIPTSALANEMKPHAHAVNVTLIAIQIGKYLSFNELQLRDLAVGCLLHDIGKALTDERDKHPEEGFNLLRKIREINLLSAHIAYQHHETIDGKGFPRRLEKGQINQYAQICGLANYYDSLISREKVAYHDALERVMASYNVLYMPEIVDAFVRSVPPYPPGMKVQLNNSVLAIVAKIDEHLHRPVVRLLDSGKEIPLAEYPTIMIES